MTLPPLHIPPPILADINAVAAWLASTVHSGTSGVVALAILVLPLLIGLTQLNDFYGDTIGYGLSILLQAWFLRASFSFEPLSVGDFATGACLLYGSRLAFYIYIREQVTAYRPHKAQDALPRLLRIPESMGLALFFACLVSPLLFLLQRPPKTPMAVGVGWAGVAFSWIGVLLEAQADAQKYVVKVKAGNQNTTFQGPTNGVFCWCRHPNYAGEIMFWLGLWLAGFPSFSGSLPTLLCAVTGQAGILAVVLRIALRRIEQKQSHNYSGQPYYELWKKRVPSTIMPFISVDTCLESLGF